MIKGMDFDTNLSFFIDCEVQFRSLKHIQSSLILTKAPPGGGGPLQLKPPGDR